MRFTIHSKSATYLDRKLTTYEVHDILCTRTLPDGSTRVGRRVASFSEEEDAVQYAAWRNRCNDLPQPGDVA